MLYFASVLQQSCTRRDYLLFLLGLTHQLCWLVLSADNTTLSRPIMLWASYSLFFPISYRYLILFSFQSLTLFSHLPAAMSVVDPRWELTDPNPNIHELFLTYDRIFFYNTLQHIEVRKGCADQRHGADDSFGH